MKTRKYISSQINIRPYTNVLRKLGGWVKDYESYAGGCRIVIFTKEIRKRTLILQLWGDGKHRVTFSLKGRECTVPTDFQDVNGMIEAILIETIRYQPPVIYPRR